MAISFTQTFFPKMNWCFFAVRVLPAEAPKSDDPIPISIRFNTHFAPECISDPLITIPSNTHNMNHFLSLGDWFQEVAGLTGGEVDNIAQNSLPEVWPLVHKSINSYVAKKNKELWGEDPAVKVSMCDYNECVLSNMWIPGHLLILCFQCWVV